MQTVKDDDVFHYDRTLIRQICYGFISTFGDAEAENYRKILALSSLKLFVIRLTSIFPFFCIEPQAANTLAISCERPTERSEGGISSASSAWCDPFLRNHHTQEDGGWRARVRRPKVATAFGCQNLDNCGSHLGEMIHRNGENINSWSPGGGARALPYGGRSFDRLTATPATSTRGGTRGGRTG